ncbi:dihydrofolate reductase family protein [Streptosporangium sp. G11]|uniref:dihydrofolate reductase family protein n=1 Tax=Streptosporangium sp. G11 TaxID=3436926 RepID=UPI003EB93A78
MNTSHARRIVAQCGVSIDGYSSGPDGPEHDTWLYGHAATEASAEHFEGLWRGCSSALVGRTNYVGFHSVWPGITRDPATDPRTRELGRWLDSVDKAVVSTTLTEAPWENSRIFTDLSTAVATLRSEPGRDILVLNSATVIQSLLAADLVDDLRLSVLPVLLGGGLRLLPEGVSSGWSLVSSTAMAHGAIAVHYRRSR